MEIFLNLFMPQSCVCCGRLSASLCSDCSRSLKVLGKNYYYSKVVKNFIQEVAVETINIYCVFDYEGVFEECIKIAKFNPKSFQVLKELTNQITLPKSYFANSVLIPVPINRARFLERGFNQAEIISKHLSRRFCAPTSDVLVRTRDTVAQFKNKRSERFENLSGAFKLKPFTKLPKNKRLIIVDDICTSGATLSEIHSLLVSLGYTNVEGFCLSKKLSTLN